MIICSKCGVLQPPENFSNRPAKLNGKASCCHACNVKAVRGNPRTTENQIRNHRLRKQKCIDAKGGMCRVCGAKDLHPAAYDFHHRNPAEKEFSLKIARGRSLDRVMAELDKCDLLCSNCHRTLHAKY